MSTARTTLTKTPTSKLLRTFAAWTSFLSILMLSSCQPTYISTTNAIRTLDGTHPPSQATSRLTAEYRNALESRPVSYLSRITSDSYANHEEMLDAALCFHYGIHATANQSKSKSLLLKVASEAYPAGCFTLAMAYREGVIFDKDLLSEKIWLRESANVGVGEAAYLLSQHYTSGGGRGRNDGIAWLYASAELGYDMAQTEVISLVAKTGELPEDVEQVKNWALRLSEKESRADALFVLGLSLMHQRSIDDGKRYLQFAAEQNYVPAMLALSRFSLSSEFEPSDPKASLGWIRRAADLSDGRAMLMLAEIQYLGLFGQPRDTSAALKLLKNAESLSEKNAELNKLIADYHLNILKSPQGALSFYREASSRGNVDAQVAMIHILSRKPETRQEAVVLAQKLHGLGVENGSVALAKLRIDDGEFDLKSSDGPVTVLYRLSISGNVAAQLEFAKLCLGRSGSKASSFVDHFEGSRWLFVIMDRPGVQYDYPMEWYVAATTLADCYEKGIGVPQDSDSASTLRQIVSEVSIANLLR